MGGFLTYQHYRETHLSRYEQVRFLGRGGFGAAYLFKDTHARSLCVLKVSWINGGYRLYSIYVNYIDCSHPVVEKPTMFFF